jgi:hypothetical protein
MALGFDGSDMQIMDYDAMIEAQDYIRSLEIPSRHEKKKKPKKIFKPNFSRVSELLSEQTRKPKPILKFLDQHGDVSRMFDTKTGEVITFEKKGKKD